MSRNDPHAAESLAIRLSVIVGFLMLAGKTTAWSITGSAAILSDAAESIVHVIAVIFAAFSMRLSFRPATQRYQYGYERVSFFSAGFEGGMIILAAVLIIVEAIQRWRAGLLPQNLEAGTWLIAAASVVNLVLGWYLVRIGRRAQSIILEANGRHVLTDSWTSFGVVGGLLLVMWTDWAPFDPILAILVALNIVWSGVGLVRRSIRGLMDYADPDTDSKLRAVLDPLCDKLGIQYHELRHRESGSRLLIDVHLLFPYHTPVGKAHEAATVVEKRLTEACDTGAAVVTHLESLEDHDAVHKASGNALSF
jgi:cation diffusion facilitator family transporter